MDGIVVTGARAVAPDTSSGESRFESREALIEALRELIETGQIDEARRLLDEAGDLHPDLDLPDDVERALVRPDSNETEPDA